jgi:hypothetical protein
VSKRFAAMNSTTPAQSFSLWALTAGSFLFIFLLQKTMAAQAFLLEAHPLQYYMYGSFHQYKNLGIC